MTDKKHEEVMPTDTGLEQSIPAPATRASSEVEGLAAPKCRFCNQAIENFETSGAGWRWRHTESREMECCSDGLSSTHLATPAGAAPQAGSRNLTLLNEAAEDVKRMERAEADKYMRYAEAGSAEGHEPLKEIDEIIEAIRAGFCCCDLMRGVIYGIHPLLNQLKTKLRASLSGARGDVEQEIERLKREIKKAENTAMAVTLVLRGKCSDKEWEGMPEEFKAAARIKELERSASAPRCPKCGSDRLGILCRDCRKAEYTDSSSDDFAQFFTQPARQVEPEGKRIDISNLRFYALMAKENKWSTTVIHESVISQTLNEIADRLEATGSEKEG